MGRHRIKNIRENLIKTQGQAFVDDMEKLKTNYGISCQGLATKYGFSRQHIGNIFKQLNNTTYATYRKGKTDKIIAENVDCRFDPRQKLANASKSGRRAEGARIQIRFMKECQRRGFDLKVSSNQIVSLYVNDYAIKIPVIRLQTRRICSSFAIKSSKKKFFDFFAPYVASHDAFFIIPMEEFADLSFAKKYQTIYIRNEFSDYFNAKNRYMKCLNDFDRLKRKNTREKSHD